MFRGQGTVRGYSEVEKRQVGYAVDRWVDESRALSTHPRGMDTHSATQPSLVCVLMERITDQAVPASGYQPQLLPHRGLARGQTPPVA
jgi:hypothetical protein